MSNEYKARIGKLVDNISESYRKECYIAPHDLRIFTKPYGNHWYHGFAAAGFPQLFRKNQFFVNSGLSYWRAAGMYYWKSDKADYPGFETSGQ